jgi:hypothetical protein
LSCPLIFIQQALHWITTHLAFNSVRGKWNNKPDNLPLGGQLVHATIEDAMSCPMKSSIDPKSSIMTLHLTTLGNFPMHERPAKMNMFVYQVRVYPVDIESLNLPLLLKTTINFMVLQSNGRIALLK